MVAESSFNEILVINEYIQPNVFFCGPTVIYLILDYWGMENVDFKKLVKLMFSESMKGTANSSMIFYPPIYGLKSYSFNGNIKLLKKLLKKRIPVIVLQNLYEGFKLGHFRIVVGMDNQKKMVYLKDPAKKKIQKMKWTKFESLWERGNSINNHKWGMIIVPEFFDFQIDEIYNSPLTALNTGTYYYRKFDYVKACAEFKKAYHKNKKNRDVLKYYAQGLIRLRHFSLASEIINQLIELVPNDPVAYDLLGLKLFYTGQYQAALIALEKAVRLNKKKTENPFIMEHYQQVKRFTREKD
ncbi:MAG: C39 family peptidase [Candidatus Aminicenantes bacterium]|nr:C39 family peptidase [Candidatus Aminicenantes bacterium]